MNMDRLFYLASDFVDKMRVDVDGTYAQVFDKKDSRMAVERKAQIRIDGDGPSFMFCAGHQEIGFVVGVVPDNDPRANGDGNVFAMEQVRDGAVVKPWRASDLPKATHALKDTFRDKRNLDAAAVLNGADRYDVTIGGDGVALCSENHPHKHGVWSNTFKTQQDLNRLSLAAALDQIGNGFVDDQGLKIRARGKQLIVPRNLEEAAHTALDRLEGHEEMRRTPIVWDALAHPCHWFIKTNIPGLMWFERVPIEFGTWRDDRTGMVLIKGYERRCFQYMDPRSVFGSLPSGG